MSTFASALAVDENGYVANGATGQVFAPDDETAANPLAITDLNGIAFAGNELTASGLGVLPSIRCVGYVVVDWVSGLYRIPLTAIDLIPAGGGPGQTLAKVSSSDFDAEWVDSNGGSGVPDGGTAGQMLTKLTSANGEAGWVDPVGGGGNAMLFYDGVQWPVRDDFQFPRMWVSTQHPTAPMPGMNEGDMWIRHPDALEAP